MLLPRTKEVYAQIRPLDVVLMHKILNGPAQSRVASFLGFYFFRVGQDVAHKLYSLNASKGFISKPLTWTHFGHIMFSATVGFTSWIISWNDKNKPNPKPEASTDVRVCVTPRFPLKKLSRGYNSTRKPGGREGREGKVQ